MRLPVCSKGKRERSEPRFTTRCTKEPRRFVWTRFACRVRWRSTLDCIATMRTLLRFDTALTVVAAIAFVVAGYVSEPTILDDSIASRFLDYPILSRADAVRFELDSLDSIKNQLPWNYAKSDEQQWQQLTNVVCRACNKTELPSDLRASSSSTACACKNHFRKLDGPQVGIVRLCTSTDCRGGDRARAGGNLFSTSAIWCIIINSSRLNVARRALKIASL